MLIVPAVGIEYNPAIVFTRKLAHYRVVHSVVQTVQSFFDNVLLLSAISNRRGSIDNVRLGKWLYSRNRRIA